MAFSAFQLLGLAHHFDQLVPSSSHPSSHLASSLALLQAKELRTLEFTFGVRTADRTDRKDCQRISVQDSLLWRVLAVGHAIARPCGQSFFANLSDIKLANARGAAQAFHFSAVAVLLRLPSVRTLRLADFRDGSSSDDFASDSYANNSKDWDCEVRSSNVNDIELLRCEFDTTSISLILNACKAIRWFFWTRECPHADCQSADHVKFVDYSRMYEALLPHRDSLESLDSLQTMCNPANRHHQVVHADIPFSTMQSLHRLEDLYLGSSAIHPSRHLDARPLRDILPESLKTFEICADESSQVKELVCRLADLCRQRPKLVVYVELARDFEISQLGELRDLHADNLLKGICLLGGKDLWDGENLIMHSGASVRESIWDDSYVTITRSSAWELVENENKDSYVMRNIGPAIDGVSVPVHVDLSAD